MKKARFFNKKNRPQKSEIKKMSSQKIELPKAYNAKEYEDEIYKKWESSGFFDPDVCVRKKVCKKKSPVFSLMMPPPNVTGVLHLGHALENTLMDTMARYQRMQGKRTLFLPGTDHAAVATQARVEKDLIDSGKYRNPREELGREKLLEIIREYAEDSKSTIIKQVKKLGSSCDWSRLAYTFDKERSRAVNAMFKKMYDDGLIYRDYRTVNWSVKGQSTCSDDELVHVERKATLYTFKYAKDFPISIATTRPETKLGDTAVAVNPKDKRYKKYIGKVFIADVGAVRPLNIKIIADKSVDMEFGTGAFGVTPAHSQIDYEIYEKQKAKKDPIGLIPVINKDGRMNENTGRNYKGLKVEEAREKFVGWLKKQGLLEKEEEIEQNVGTSDRFKDPVEVLPMEQWFVNVNKRISGRGKTLKDLMREAVTRGHSGDVKQKIKITPKRFEKSYLQWIDNLRDWCISRQVWWGHRIPVWYRKSEIRNPKPETSSKSKIQNLKIDAEIKIQIESPGSGWEQDPDTLDTWFSSGLWTFSTLGWPEETKDLKVFHPTTWMQMGYEILFFWMARMVLASTYALNEIPFKDVYIHGMLRDKQGKKFSKSDKTGTDPLELIGQYGTDALRLSLLIGIAPGNDSRFYEEKIRGSRNFVNKLWNVSRFILGRIDAPACAKALAGKNMRITRKNLTLSDKWILSEMNKTVGEVTKAIKEFHFSMAGEILQEFTWTKLADWYLEISKIEPGKNDILMHILINLLKLWQPFTPFVTEEIWSYLSQDMLMIQKWPEVDDKLIDTKAKDEFAKVQELVMKIRNLLAKKKIAPKEIIKIKIKSEKYQKFAKEQKEMVEGLARAKIVSRGEEALI